MCEGASGVGPTGAYGAGSYQESVYLTPEALLVYCQDRVGQIDSDIQAMIADLRMELRHREAVDNVKNTMDMYHPPDTDDEMTNVLNAFDAAIASLPPGDPVRAELERRKGEIMERYRGGIDPSNWEAEIGSMESFATEIGADSQLNMLAVQSLMSDRQTAFQLATNILSKLDQTAQAVVKNI